MTATKPALLPCPFCGGEAEEIAGLVGCLRCACGRRDAKSWNTRSDTALEIGRAMGREEAAKVCEEQLAAMRRDMPDTEDANLTTTMDTIMVGVEEFTADYIATIRSTPSTLDIEGLVEECAFTAYEACLDPAERDSAKAMWEKRPAILKDAWRCVARAVLTHLGLKEPIP